MAENILEGRTRGKEAGEEPRNFDDRRFFKQTRKERWGDINDKGEKVPRDNRINLGVTGETTVWWRENGRPTSIKIKWSVWKLSSAAHEGNKFSIMMELLRSRNLGTQQYCLPLKRDLTFVEAKNTSYQSLTDRRPVLKNVSFQSIYQYVLVDDKNKVLRGSKLNQRIIEKSFSKNSLSQKACRSLPLQLIEKILAYLSSAELVRLFMPLHNQHINPLKLAVGHSLQKKLLGQNHV